MAFFSKLALSRTFTLVGMCVPSNSVARADAKATQTGSVHPMAGIT